MSHAEPNELVTEEDRVRLLREWNDTGNAIPEQSVPELFEQQVSSSPDAIALEAGGSTLSYCELNRRANAFALRLTECGVQPGDAVGILMARSTDLVVALLAVAKAGAAYVPVDMRSPGPRILAALRSARCSLLVSDLANSGHEATTGRRVLVFEADDALGAENPRDRVPTPDALLYVMHTSGTSGEPKGVEVTHRNVAALALDRIWRSGNHRRVLLHSPHAFDASTFEIWVPLLAGGTIVVAPEEVNAVLLRNFGEAGKITSLWLTAGLFQALAEADPECLENIAEVWAGGDVLPPRSVRRVSESCPRIRIFNGYGPTETTTFAARYQAFPGPGGRISDVPIGSPMDNTRLYVLDEQLRLLPPGVPGQLYIAGSGVARGYSGRPVATAERFLPDPFGPPGERMYASGDLVRWSRSGELTYLGRVDRQVKLNGFRIEPGEIETVLRGCDGVAQAVVDVEKTGEGAGRIVAYVVADAVDTPERETLAGCLAERLPVYMTPDAYVFLDELPLTANGKVDHDRLRESHGAEPDGPSGVHELVRHWADRRPSAPAVQDPVTGETVNYAELWARSGRLATALAACGIGKGDIVGAHLGRSADLAVALLGTARAGAACLPLDTHASAERVRTLLADSGARAALVAPDGDAGRIPSSVPQVAVNATGDADCGDLPGGGGEDALYVTHDGLVMPHRAVLALVTGTEFCPVVVGDRVAATNAPGSCVSPLEIWSALTAGATVVPLPDLTAESLDEWAALLRGRHVSTAYLTAERFHVVSRERPDALGSLRQLVIHGRLPDPESVTRVLSAGAPARLINSHVPGEAAGFVSYFECTPENMAGLERTPIGFPVPGISLHVLDADLAPVPPGGRGELCVGGAGVAAGHLGRPEPAAERFVTEPRTGERVFRTGDTVRLLPSGALELLQEEPAGQQTSGAELCTPTERYLAEQWSELLERPVTSGDASFWELGGHSLRAITLVSRIRQRLGVRLRLRDLFEHPRLADLAEHIDARNGAAGPAAPAEPRQEQRAEAPASSFQTSIWVAQRLESEPSLYNVPSNWQVAGRLDPDRLADALAKVVADHEVLCTTFTERHGTLWQLIGAPWRPAVPVVRCADEAALEAHLRAEGDRPFDLAAGPLLRMSLVETPDRQVLSLTLHHTIVDFASLPVLLRDLDHYYTGDTDAPPRSGHGQYRELIAATEKAEPVAVERRAEALRGAPSRLPVADPSRPEPNGEVPLALPGDVLRRMRPVQDDLGASWFIVATAALAAVVHGWTGRDDITLGFPVDTRTGSESAGVVGPCLNMAVLRSTCSASTTVEELLKATRDGVLDALDDQSVPFDAIVEALNPARTAGSTPYLDVVLAPQAYPANPATVGGCRMTPLPSAGAGAIGKFAVTLGLNVLGEHMAGSLLYRGDRVSARTAAELARQYVRILDAMLDERDRTVASLRFGSAAPKGPPSEPDVRDGGADHGAPGDTERRVMAIWSRLLGTSGIDANDNFFDRGGNSIKLVALHAELCREFGVEMPLQRLFENSTVRSMSSYFHNAAGEGSAGGNARPPSAGLDVAARGAARRARSSRATGGR